MATAAATATRKPRITKVKAAELEAARIAAELEAAQAAELESIAEATAKQVKLCRDYKALNAVIKAAESQRDDLKTTIMSSMEDAGVSVLTHDGAVIAEVADGVNTGLRTKDLKAEEPTIYERFFRVTTYKKFLIK